MKKPVKVLLTGSILLVVGAVGGVVCTVLGMVHTFNQLGTQPAGPATTQHLASQISSALLCSGIGFGVALIGLCLALGGAIAYFNQRDTSEPKKCRRTTVVLAVILVLVIVFVLMVVMMPPCSGPSGSARRSATLCTLNIICGAAIPNFVATQQRLPNTLAELTIATSNHPIIMYERGLLDAWGHPSPARPRLRRQHPQLALAVTAFTSSVIGASRECACLPMYAVW